MIHTSKLTKSFGEKTLFEDVSIKFTAGNCYGLIGANGAGKSTFLKILAGDIEQTSGDIIVEPGKRIAVLKQDQFAYDAFSVLETVIMGYPELYKIYKERTDLYAKDEMTDDEGLRIGDLEMAYSEMDGYTLEADAATMLSEIGIKESLHEKKMDTLEPGEKIRVLLAQALFGNPDILLLDEPTNQLDYLSTLWLENYLMDFENTVLVVSHDRHFLNKVCTHIADVDFGQINVFAGNYDFWYKSSKLAMQQREDQNKKAEQKISELEDFVRRFSANASKSKQATSRKKLIDKLRPEDLPVSRRRAPYIHFKPQRQCGNKILKVTNLSASIDNEVVLKNVSFTIEKGDKVAIAGRNALSKTALLQCLSGEIKPDSGSIEWGETIQVGYFPKDNTEYFNEQLSLIDWISKYKDTDDISFLRGFLGRMLFSGDDVKKMTHVLSGGEKARAMFSRMMLSEPNALLFDEPTDHLDLEAIDALNEGLEAFKECLFVSSHDFQLLNTVTNRVIEVSPKGMIDFKANYDDYMQNKSNQEKREALYN